VMVVHTKDGGAHPYHFSLARNISRAIAKRRQGWQKMKMLSVVVDLANLTLLGTQI
jgi:hypothetical protein